MQNWKKAQTLKLKKEKDGLDAGLRRTVSLEFTHWTAGALQIVFDLDLGSTDLGFDRRPFLLGEYEKDL